MVERSSAFPFVHLRPRSCTQRDWWHRAVVRNLLWKAEHKVKLIPPVESADAWPRAGSKGMFWGIFLGVLLSAAAFWFTGSYWWLTLVPLFACVGFIVRIRPGGSTPRVAKPPNARW